MSEIEEWVGNDKGTWAIKPVHPIFSDHDGSPLGLGEDEHFCGILGTVEAVLHEEGYDGDFDIDLITVALEKACDGRSDIIFTDGGSGEELFRLVYQDEGES